MAYSDKIVGLCPQLTVIPSGVDFCDHWGAGHEALAGEADCRKKEKHEQENRVPSKTNTAPRGNKGKGGGVEIHPGRGRS